MNVVPIVVSGWRRHTDANLIIGHLSMMIHRIERGGVNVYGTVDNPRMQWQPNLVHVRVGDASGVDAIARKWCAMERVSHTVYHANWDMYGVAAGPIRNRQMLDGEGDGRGVASELLAFPEPVNRCKGSGTWNCIHTAVELGIPVTISGALTA